MHPRCDGCGLAYERGPGYFLGSIYFNYGLTALLVTAGYLALWFTDAMSPEALLASLAVFSVLFPLWFFRWARALWIGFDLYFDPPSSETLGMHGPGD